MFPKLRFGHKIIKLDNGDYLIGSATYGISHIVHESTRKFEYLNEILDGTRDYNDVISAICEKIKVSEDSARLLMNNLVKKGHIEYSDYEHFLSDYDLERFSRGLLYYSWIDNTGNVNPYETQEVLKKSRACVIGVGGIGGVVASNLVASGIGQITVVDFDTVEVSNLNRQILFTEENIGERKSSCAHKNLQKINSHVDIRSADIKISSPEDLIKYFSDHDIVFRCADSPNDIPYWFSDVSLRTKKPWVDASYNGPMINCCIYSPGETGCYRCVRESNQKTMDDYGFSNITKDRTSIANASISPISQMAGSLAAYEGIRYLARLNPQSLGRAIHQNMHTYSNHYVVEVPRVCKHS